MTNPADDGLWQFGVSLLEQYFTCLELQASALSLCMRFCKESSGLHPPIPSLTGGTSVVKLRPWDAEPSPSPHSSSYTENRLALNLRFQAAVSDIKSLPIKALTDPSGLFDGWK